MLEEINISNGPRSRGMELTQEQKEAIQHIQKNIKNKDYQTLGGYAGTGKSTCLSVLAEKYPTFKTCAFTGKAAHVLRKKGISDANTIHSTIYTCKEDEDGDIHFQLKRSYERDFDGLFVDEASMISKDLFDDIMSFNVPVVFFGDHGQLEPIKSDFNLMQKPQITLEKIHRNANTIAQFANYLRLGGEAKNFNKFDDTVKFVSKKTVSIKDLSKADQVICAFNKTRCSINNKVRECLGHKNIIEKNEKIICLKNNRMFGIFNGMQGNVTNVKNKKITFVDYDNNKFILDVFMNQFGMEKLHESAQQDKDRGYFDYSYAITCHKAQGDEWDDIIVIEERCDLWDHKRWAYTAASRAKKSILWVV